MLLCHGKQGKNRAGISQVLPRDGLRQRQIETAKVKRLTAS